MGSDAGPPPVEMESLLINTQGDVFLGGIMKKNEHFVFMSIDDPQKFCETLHLDTSIDLFSSGRFVVNHRKYIIDTKNMAKELGLPPPPLLIGAQANISFSATGLQKIATVMPDIGISDKWKKYDHAFWGGMEADAADTDTGLKDPMDRWEPGFKGRKIDVLVLIAGSDEKSVVLLEHQLTRIFEGSLSVVKIDKGETRQGPNKDHEHFGFNDGVSQPTVQGFPPDNLKIPDGTVGQLGDRWNTVPQHAFVVQNADGARRPKWTEHGSFLVYRKLEQDVAKWNLDIVNDAETRKIDPHLLAAKIVGRWKSGCPVMTSTTHDDTSQAFNNSFDFVKTPRPNKDDAICPSGSHIRKMNPDRGMPDPKTGVATTKGRMLRRGITYGTDFHDGDTSTDRGLHFVCYQSRIEDSFKMVQKFWANQDDFPGGGAGVDSLTGNLAHGEKSRIFVFDDDHAAKGSEFKFENFNPYVIARGGEYFFTPTLPALRSTLSKKA